MRAVATWAATVQALCNEGVITLPRVRDAMVSTDRANYCKPQTSVYQDSPQRIGWGITISAPHMHARALEELNEKLQPGSTVLDVGSGSGFLTVAMSQLVGTDGKVVGIDHIPDLVVWSKTNVQRDGKQQLLDSGAIELLVRDGFGGYPERGPYDAIHVGAAPPSIPEALKQQLKPGGVLILPVGPDGGEQHFMRVTRTPDGNRFEEKRLFGVRYVPLCSAEKRKRPLHAVVIFCWSHACATPSPLLTHDHPVCVIFDCSELRDA